MKPTLRLAAVVLAAAASAIARAGVLHHPEDFRLFTHVTSGIVTPGFVFDGVDLCAQVPGLHQIYANRPALQG